MPWRTPATGAAKTRKLTEQTVAEIRHRWAAGGVEQQQLAAEYGVSTGLITALVRGVIWKQAPGPIMPGRHRSGVPHIKTRLPAEVGPCAGCGRLMVRHRDWRESPELWRARGAVHCAGKGRCVSCADARRGAPGWIESKKAPAAAPKPMRRQAKMPPPTCKPPRPPGVDARPARPAKPGPLSPAELVRLRRLVGLPDVLPEERAS